MTALTRSPQNTNYLQPTKYILTIDRIPTVQYFCQEANVPGISLGQAAFNTPFVDLAAPGNKLTFEKFNIRFNIDEPVVSWQELYKWFLSIAAPSGFDERTRQTSLQNQTRSNKKTHYSDGMLTVLSALNNPLLRVQFHNMFPISLTDIAFDTKESADDIITASATFYFDYFEFLPLTT